VTPAACAHSHCRSAGDFDADERRDSFYFVSIHNASVKPPPPCMAAAWQHGSMATASRAHSCFRDASEFEWCDERTPRRDWQQPRCRHLPQSWLSKGPPTRSNGTESSLGFSKADSATQMGRRPITDSLQVCLICFCHKADRARMREANAVRHTTVRDLRNQELPSVGMWNRIPFTRRWIVRIRVPSQVQSHVEIP